jgi:hypothetical protein
MMAFVGLKSRVFFNQSEEFAKPTPAIDYKTFDRLLKKYVDDWGLVNYNGFKADSTPTGDWLANKSSF